MCNHRIDDLIYWISLDSVDGIGPVSARRIHQMVPSFRVALALDIDSWREFGLTPILSKSLYNALHSDQSRDIVARIQGFGVQFVTEQDEYYPVLLREISCPPPVLYYDGTLSWDGPTIAIVGTRQCTSYGRRATLEIAKSVIEEGGVVISGLANGIDQAAHQGTTQALGQTVAVLGSGIRQIYPRNQEALVQAILAHRGAIVSEFLPWALPLKHHFPQRNRVISGMSRAVIVVEAAHRSGALITAEYAIEQNREVMAVPGSLFSSLSAGTNRLIADGAIPLLSTQNILAAANILSLRADSGMHGQTLHVGECAKVLQELTARAMSLNQLYDAVKKYGFTPQSLGALLTNLELEGIVQRDGVGEYSVVK